MKHFEIQRPIGLDTPCMEIEDICAKAYMYKRSGLRPKHFIIPLDPGSGRSTLLEYMTDKYKDAGVMAFASGLDDCIEVTFDGTLQQLKQAFDEIDAAAVYTNAFCSIIGMDISEIAAHLGETQYAEFMKNCRRVCENACVVFFVHAAPNRNEEKLIEKLCEMVDNIKRLTVEPYTREDMCDLIIKAVADHGIEIRHMALFRALLSEMVAEFAVSCVRDAITAADTLVQFADFSGFTPEIDENSLKAMIQSLHENAERSEVK